MTIVTRFPPSPTGYLHIGGARTALFNWLYARRYGGRFVLRIEDTDRARSTQEAVDAIFEGMAWLGLDYDDGPYFQTKRFDRYDVAIEKLLANDKAYHCYCSRERLEELRTGQMTRKEKPRYDGHCRDRSARPPIGVEPVVRFRTPQSGDLVVADRVHGEVVFLNEELDDLIIARSDGTPTYHLTVVVDDIDMGITHVIRGDDHLNNTPRQIHILEGLGATRPVYAHVPMINGSDGKKLSKRHGAVSVTQYRDDGFLPEALLNYLARLGWSHGDAEVFTANELIEWFDLSGISASPARFNAEKLAWLNSEHIKRADPQFLGGELEHFLLQAGCKVVGGPDPVDVGQLYRERAIDLQQMAESAQYLYGPPLISDELRAQHLGDDAKALVAALLPKLEALAWEREAIGAALKAFVAERKVKMPQVMMPVRVAVSGTTQTPAVDAVLAVLGRTRTLERLTAAIG